MKSPIQFEFASFVFGSFASAAVFQFSGYGRGALGWYIGVVTHALGISMALLFSPRYEAITPFEIAMISGALFPAMCAWLVLLGIRIASRSEKVPRQFRIGHLMLLVAATFLVFFCFHPMCYRSPHNFGVVVDFYYTSFYTSSTLSGHCIEVTELFGVVEIPIPALVVAMAVLGLMVLMYSWRYWLLNTLIRFVARDRHTNLK